MNVDVGWDEALGHVSEAQKLEGYVEGGDDFGQGGGTQFRKHELSLRSLATADYAVGRDDADAKPDDTIGCAHKNGVEG